MNRKLSFNLLAAAILVAGTSPAAGATYSFADDFGTTSNPNGVWMYQSVPIGDPNSAAADMVTPDTITIEGNNWQDSIHRDWNLLGPAGYVHPGNLTDSLLGFAYPLAFSSMVSIDVSMVDGDNNTSTNGKVASFWLNDTKIGDDVSLPGNYPGSIPWNESIMMSPGDRFYFRVNKGPQDVPNFGDSQYGFVTIQTVPEPAALSLAGLGLLALAMRRRRR